MDSRQPGYCHPSWSSSHQRRIPSTAPLEFIVGRTKLHERLLVPLPTSFCKLCTAMVGNKSADAFKTNDKSPQSRAKAKVLGHRTPCRRHDLRSWTHTARISRPTLSRSRALSGPASAPSYQLLPPFPPTLANLSAVLTGRAHGGRVVPYSLHGPSGQQ